MKVFLGEDELEEISPLENCPKNDNAIIITPEVGKRGDGKEELQKEIIGLDALLVGPKEASRIHGVPESSASKYSNGQDIQDNDAKSRIMAQRHGIADTAVAKLMTTLDLIDPSDISMLKVTGKQVDIANKLSQIVERVQGKDKDSNRTLVLHLHAPDQKKETDYVTIDV